MDTVKLLKETSNERISEYVKHHPNATYVEGCTGIWTLPCNIALPCATQNEIDATCAEELVKNGVNIIAEGANMPSTEEAIEIFHKNDIIFAPAMAVNAGGVTDPAMLAAGVSQALITTAAGMVVAIPALIAYRYFQRKIVDIAMLFETRGNQLLSMLFYQDVPVSELHVNHTLQQPDQGLHYEAS